MDKKYNEVTVRPAANGFIIEVEYKEKLEDSDYEYKTDRFVFSTFSEVAKKIAELWGITS